MKTARYFHTIRHLKLKQIIFRLLYKFHKPTITMQAKADYRNQSKNLIQPISKIYSSLHQNFVEVLNKRIDISIDNKWRQHDIEKLHMYNLQYFDYINNYNNSNNKQILALIDDWIKYCTPCHGDAWEPYPISLRIVNWIKWLLQNQISNDSIS